MRAKALAIGIALLVLTGVVGCRFDQETNEAAAGAAFKVATGMASQQELVQGAAALMPGLPDDVPMMDGATVVSATAGTVTFTVDASADDVTAYYHKEMEANGWALQESETPNPMTFTKDSRTAQVAVGDSQPTEVTITVSAE